MLNAVIQKAWTSGGQPSVILAGPSQKTNLSDFDGVAGQTKHEIADRKIIATADVYVSNFGELKVVPTRYIRQTSNVDREVYIIDPEYLKLGVLRDFQSWDLAKTGDSVKKQMIFEGTLVVANEAAHAICADLS